jgi:hypothetical protein
VLPQAYGQEERAVVCVTPGLRPCGTAEGEPKALECQCALCQTLGPSVDSVWLVFWLGEARGLPLSPLLLSALLSTARIWTVLRRTDAELQEPMSSLLIMVPTELCGRGPGDLSSLSSWYWHQLAEPRSLCWE